MGDYTIRKWQDWPNLCMYMGLILPLIILHVSSAVFAAGNPELSFEGKIVTSTGVSLTDGSYAMEFQIYTGCTNNTGAGCTAVWTEDYTGAGQLVTFTSGTFQVNLGSINPFGSSVPWDTSPLYLSLQIGNASTCTPAGNFQANCGGAGVMTPYILLTSTPYAQDSAELDGLTASQFGQLATANTWTNTNDFQASSTTALQVSNSSETILTADTSGDQVLLGQAGTSGDNGTLVFNSATSAGYAITLNTSSTLAASYSLTLPANAPGTSQCLQSGPSTPGDLAFGTCSTLQSAYNGGSTISTSAGGTVTISTSAPPTANIVSISNSGHPVSSSGVNGLGITFSGGSAAVTGDAGLRIDYSPGTTSGGSWDGLRINDAGSGAASGVTTYGLELDGPSSSGSGDDEAMYIGSGWDIGMDIQSGGIQLAAQSDPAQPAANNLKIYAKSVAGLVMPEWISSTDQNTPFQPGLGFNRVEESEPNGTANCSTGTTGFGSVSTGAGTCTAPAPSSTNLMTSVRMEDYSSGTTAGTVAYQRQDTLQVWRGNASGEGGFFYTARFGMGTLVSGNRVFVGLADSVANPTNVDPTTNTTPGKLGMAIDTTSGDWNWINNITGSAPTVTNLGSSFPVNNTDLYELIIYCPIEGSTITYRVTDESTGAQVTNSVSSNIPGTTTFLAPMFMVTNNATASAAILDFNEWYLQSDN